MYVRVKPDDENTAFAGGVYVYRTTTGFSTKPSSIGGYSYNFHPDEHALAFLFTVPGIPIVYYGTEQMFNGGAVSSERNIGRFESLAGRLRSAMKSPQSHACRTE